MVESKDKKEFIVFGKPHIAKDEINEMIDTLESGWIGTGPKTKLFERSFAEYVGAKYAIGLNSCTAGLHLALDTLDIGQGDENHKANLHTTKYDFNDNLLPIGVNFWVKLVTEFFTK